jgi:Ca2+-binding RTX toxin-like protein
MTSAPFCRCRVFALPTAFTCALTLLIAANATAQVQLAPGHILLADLYPLGGAAMVMEPVTGERTLLTGVFDVFGGARDIALESGPSKIVLVLVSEFAGGGSLIRIDPSTGGQTTVASGLGFVGGVAVEADGHILVTSGLLFGGVNGVTRIDPSTGAKTTLSAGGSFSSPEGIAVEADGSILVADADAFGGAGGVIRVNPSTGAQTTVSSGGSFVDPFDVAVESSGHILVADAAVLESGTGAVIRVHPSTGVQTIVSSGGLFVDPFGIAVEASGAILVADVTAFSSLPSLDTGGIFRVDPTTGAQTTLVQGPGGTNSLFNPMGLAVVPPNVAPTVTVGGGQCLSDNDARAVIELSLADADGPPGALTVTATSSNPSLVPDGALLIAGTGGTRTLSIAAAPKQSGTTTITVSVSDGFDTTALEIPVAVGTPQTDTLVGGNGTDVLFGMGGGNTLIGGSGNDLLCGGNGTDTLLGQDGNDVLDGGRGNDSVEGGAGDDLLVGRSGDDSLTGGGGADLFSGGAGADTFIDFSEAEGDTQSDP